MDPRISPGWVLGLNKRRADGSAPPSPQVATGNDAASVPVYQMLQSYPKIEAIRRSRTLPPGVVGGAVCPNVWERQDRIPAPKGNAVNDYRNEIRRLSMIADPHELARAVNQVVS